jgi:hypothetical protein
MEDQRPATNDPQQRRQMNAHKSSTRNLPNEVLSFVFELVCAPTAAEDIPKRPRIALASVCSHWHDVVWNTPQLWQTFSIEVRGYTLKKAASTLQMFADNHRAPGFISLTFSLYNEDIEELWQPLEAFFSQETAPCIRRINLCGLTTDCMAVAALINERCCNIEELRLSQGRGFSLSRRGFEIPKFWSTLTTLQLERIPLDIWFDLLFGCPRLVKLACFRLAQPTNGLTQLPSHQARMMRFPHLEYLTLDASRQFGDRTWVDNFLQFYRFPALKRLHWFLDSCSYSLELFNQFLSALPECCDTLQFVIFPKYLAVDRDQPSLEQCIETAILHVDKIKNLILSCPHQSPLASMLQMLLDSTVLPSLTSFQYHQVCRSFDPEIELTMRDIYKIFQSRKETGAKSFRFQVPDWGFKFLDWEDQRAKLSRLMDDSSFEVEIICGREKLDI